MNRETYAFKNKQTRKLYLKQNETSLPPTVHLPKIMANNALESIFA
jgi:hypothetical protein